MNEQLDKINCCIGKIARHCNQPKANIDTSNRESYVQKETFLYQHLFEQFYVLGVVASREKIFSFLSISEDTLKSRVHNVLSAIWDIKCWLVRRYRLSKNIEMVNNNFGSHKNFDLNFYCTIRSGIKFMIDLFKGFNDSVDRHFKKFRKKLKLSFDKSLKKKYYNGSYYYKRPIEIDLFANHRWWP